MSRLRLAALSLLISVATSTFEYPKSSGDYPSSSKPTVSRISPLQRGMDRRATHWESRSNSNLDDERAEDDRDGGSSRIPYSSFVEERPPLGYPRRIEQSAKLSNKIDATVGSVEDDSRLAEACVARKPIVLVTIADAKKMLNDVRDSQRSQTCTDVFDTVRCRRRISDWNTEQPFYVEEPGWIVIDLDGQSPKGSSINERDPFYVARGKRSLPSSAKSQENGRHEDDESTKSDSADGVDPEKNRHSPGAPGKNYPTGIPRVKRESYDQARSRSLLEEAGAPNPPELSAGKSRSNDYVQLRDKHSDIFDLLNEPFFISRGKKTSARRTGLLEWNDRYAEVLKNFGARKQALDGHFARASRSKGADDPGPVADPSPYRDRRGLMEELLEQTDPFYVARGKRSMPTALMVCKEKLNRLSSSSTESALSTEGINENSSVRVEH